MRAIIAVALLAGCGSKSKEAPPPEHGSAGSASSAGSARSGGSGASPGSGVAVKVVPLRWTAPGGEPLLALTATGEVEGPCGTVGKLAGGDITIGAQTLTWSGVERAGRTYKVAPLPWTIEVGSSGQVTLTQAGKPAVPLGTVTGTETEEGARLFSALVVAAPTIQIELSLASTDGTVQLALVGSADLDAWTIKQAGAVIAKKSRDQSHGALATELAPGLEAGAITVTSPQPASYEVAIAGTPKPYGSPQYTVSEAPDGALRWSFGEVKAPLPLASLTGRKACKPHDKAVAALLETFLASKAGWTTTRAAELKWFGKK